MEHFGIYAENFDQLQEFLKKFRSGIQIDGIEDRAKAKVLEYSEAILQRFISEDHKHGNSVLVADEIRSLQTFSSGEKRKLLLRYLLKQEPDILILDEPFDCLDQESVAELRDLLAVHESEISYVQIFRRKADLLNFVTRIYQLGAENGFVAYGDFFKNSAEEQNNLAQIPPPISEFKDIPESLIRMHEVSVSYDEKNILQKINWEVKKNEFWKLSGPNGSGKTTILSMVYGDNPKAYGTELYIFGNRKGTGETVWEIKEKIGYFSPSLTEMFQKRNSVLEMIISGLYDSIGLYQKPSARERYIGREWLKVIGLENREKEIFLELSHAEKRMVLIARAMIKHPPLLILDEPSTGLDDAGVRKLTGLINQIAKESNTAIIYVSHRAEAGLNPEFFFELKKTEQGSVGLIK